MPITKSAIKKQRTDKKRTVVNRAVASAVRNAEKKARKSPTIESIKELYSTVDLAVKKRILKLNTASRIKAGVMRVAKVKLEKSPFGKNK